jgi:tetratricopeptide (TPR) repeat protein
MSRFSRLEFGQKNSAGKSEAAGEAIRNELFFYERAQSVFLAGDFEEALLNFSRALEKNSAFYEGWFGQVRMLIELGEYREAKMWTDKALELFPEHPELLAARAVACAKDGEISKAQAYSDNAVEKQGITSYVWLSRAEVLFARKSKMAETCLRNAIGIAGNNAPFVRLEAGRLLVRNENYSSALEYLRQAVNELPKSALAWYTLGCCLARLGMPEAENIFDQCLRLRPGWAPAQSALDRFINRGFFGKIGSSWRRLFGK